jgi:CDGSH-type Zn-finger protein
MRRLPRWCRRWLSFRTQGSSRPSGSRRLRVSTSQPAGGALITPYQDGPLIVRGDFAIAAQDGSPISAGRKTVALCRCGRSANKPLCDGSHARTGFKAPGGAQGSDAAKAAALLARPLGTPMP